MDTRTLKLARDTAYIFECLAQDLTGDAKSELGRLRDALAADERYAYLAPLADAAREAVRRRAVREAAVEVGRISSKVWRELGL